MATNDKHYVQIKLNCPNFTFNRAMLVVMSPCSPELNLLDRWVNFVLKEYLRQFSFNIAEEVKIQALPYLRTVPLEDYFEQISKLQRHCQRVIDQQGDCITD